MKELNLKAVIRQKRNLIDVQRHKSHQKISLIDNLTLIRQIKVWLTDVTEFKIKEGSKIYLSAIYDLGC